MKGTKLARMQRLRATAGSLAPYLAYMDVDEAELRRRFGEELFLRAKAASYAKNYSVVKNLRSSSYDSKYVAALLSMPASFIHAASFGWPHNQMDKKIAVAQMVLKAYRKRYPLIVIGKAFVDIWAELHTCEDYVKQVYLPKPVDYTRLMEGPLTKVENRILAMRIQVSDLRRQQGKLAIIVYDVDNLVRGAFYVHDVFSGHELLSTLPLAPGEEVYLCAKGQTLASRAVARGCEVHSHEEIPD